MADPGMFNPDSDFTHPMLPKRTPLIPEALLSLAAKLATGESRGTLDTLLFHRSECILRQGQAFFPVLVCSIQPLSLHTHTRAHTRTPVRAPLPSLWSHHKELQPRDKAGALCANRFYLRAQQAEERAWSCSHIHGGQEGHLGQHKECSLLGAAGCLVCCRLRPTGWTGSPQITRGSVPTPPVLQNFILPKELPGKLQPPGLKFLQCSPAQDCPVGLAAHPLSPPQQVSQVDGDEEAETHGSAAQRRLGWAVRAARGRLLPSVPLLWQLLRTYVGSPGWSLLHHPRVAPDPLLALSSASPLPSWEVALGFVEGIMPLARNYATLNRA